MSEYVYGTDGHEGHWLTGEEIVRCGDCLSWHRGKCYKHAYTTTIDGTDECEAGVFPMDERGFCSLGEPRGDAE